MGRHKGQQRRASTSRLEPGQDTIDRAAPKDFAGGVWIRWSYRPVDGRKPTRHDSQGPTLGIARRRARETLEELRRGPGSTWSLRDPISDYITAVSVPAIEQARLADSSRSRYLTMARLLSGECTQRHRHKNLLDGHTIDSARRRRTLTDCLKEIAALHGPGTAHHARIVLSHYVLDQLETDELIDANPLQGRRIDLSGGRDRTRVRGGVALSAEDWNAVLDHLLAMDPAEGVEKPRRGMYTLADRVAVRRNVIDLTLMQAVTGLRVGEASTVTWAMVTEDASGGMVITLPAEVVKTRRGRVVPIADRDVSGRLLARRTERTREYWPVIGSPAKPEKMWDQRQRSEATARLYTELAEELDIPELQVERTHVWRATITSLAASDGVPEAVRAAHLGHTARVNRNNYTDLHDMSALAESLGRLRPDR